MRAPIRIRLAVVFCAVFLGVIGLLEIATYTCVRAAVHAIVDHELETRLAGIEDYLTRHLERYTPEQLQAMLESRPAFQPDYLVVVGSGISRFRGRLMNGIEPPAHPGIATAGLGKTVVRVLAASRQIRGQTYSLLLGTDLGMSSAVLDRLWLILLLSIPPLLLTSAGISYWMGGRALEPIQEIVAAARSIDSRRLSQRVPVPKTGDEVQQLAETFNGMLARIEAGFRQMRDFTANASHELRTPTAVVRAAAEVALLRPRSSEAAYREALERILREAERNSSLLESMLQLSRADSGVDGMARDLLSLPRSLAAACEQMAPLALARQVNLRFAPGFPEIEILADREQLHRLWLILIDNAIKYTTAGGSVTVRAALTPEGEALGEVVDTGLGIAPEHLERIFERFFRADKARSRGMGGAGLGLAIAREIALVHEAALEVESEPGKGSRFTLRFTAGSRKPGAPSVQFVRD
jgi:heavy metal sensor kinase